MRPSERTRTVSALGVIEIFAWGSTYYLMAVLAGPMAADTGWSAGLISAGISVGLLVSGLAAPMVGRLIHATGGRRVLAAGMCLIAAGLVILGSAKTPPVYFVAWTVLGLGMSAGLYDAAFSSLSPGWRREASAGHRWRTYSSSPYLLPREARAGSWPPRTAFLQPDWDAYP